jgi:hypothetical protein
MKRADCLNQGETVYVQNTYNPVYYLKLLSEGQFDNFKYEWFKFYISNSIVAVKNVLSELRAELKKQQNELEYIHLNEYSRGKDDLINWFIGRTDKYMKIDSKKVSD